MRTVADALHDRHRDQLKRSQLQAHPLLTGCAPWVIRRVAAVADEVLFPPGELLAEQGRTPGWFLLIRSGVAEVGRNGALLGVVGAGDHYGEVPLLGRGAHPATVRAITPVHAWVIGAQRFVPLVDDVRPIRETLAASLAAQPALVAAARAELASRIQSMRREGSNTWPGIRPPRGRRSVRVLHVLAAIAMFVAVAVGAAAMYHPPYAVIRPGPVVDVANDIEISGAAVHPIHGRYLLVMVHTERPTLLSFATAAILGHHRPVEHVTALGGQPDVERQLHGQFTKSQQDAALAAAAALGIRPSASGALPFTVRFRDRDVVGPSGGLVYALAIEDMLSGADHAHGRTVAATGAIDPAGDVIPVGFVDDKAVAAQRAGAQVLVSPTSEVYLAADSGVRVVGASSLREALDRLAASN